MDEFGFTCLNNGSPTFSTPDGVRSALDVTFIRYHQGNITWNALDSKIYGSNHWPIIITFDDMECKTGKYNIFLAKKFLNKLNNMDVGENLEGFLVKINDTRKKCTLKVSPANRYVPKPWWNDELSRLFRLRNAARKKYHRTHCIEDCEKLISAEDVLKKAIFQRKREHFIRLISELSHTTDIKHFWRIINQLKKYGLEKKK